MSDPEDKDWSARFDNSDTGHWRRRAMDTCLAFVTPLSFATNNIRVWSLALTPMLVPGAITGLLILRRRRARARSL
jgi:hypothetical protein